MTSLSKGNSPFEKYGDQPQNLFSSGTPDAHKSIFPLQSNIHIDRSKMTGPFMSPTTPQDKGTITSSGNNTLSGNQFGVHTYGGPPIFGGRNMATVR